MREKVSIITFILLISFFCTVLVVQAQTQCPSACTCMLPSDAKAKGYTTLCGGKQVVCGYDKAQNPMYCYQKPATVITTTTKTPTPTPTLAQAVVITASPVGCPATCSCLFPADANKGGYPLCSGKQVVCGYDQYQNPKYCYQKPATAAPVVTTTKPTTTPSTPALTTCPSTCSCLLSADGKKLGYPLCGGKQSLCGYDQYQNPKFCFQKPVTTPPTNAPATLVTRAMETIEGLPIGTVPPIETIPMAVAPARCTVSGNIYRFFHDPETLKVRLTNIDTGESSLSAVTPVFTGDLVSHYSYVVFVQCDETYRIEPVYQPFTGACAWTGSFSGSNELRMAGASVTGQDFNYVPDDPNVPEVNVLSSPANPGMNEDVRITIEAVDDNAIVFMAARYTLVYADGSRRSVDWEELTPMPGISSRGDRPRYTDQFSITDDGLLRAEITARVCDRGGNERWGSGTVTWMTCSWCGDHIIPIEVNGDPVDKIDVIFIPDTSYAGDMDALVEDIGDVLANGYYQNDLFSDNRGKFNFYYLDDEASVTAYPACGFTPPLGSCEDFQDATTFADSIAVLHTNDFRDWSGSKCGRNVFCSEPTSYRTFVHESGHSLFGLKDEYCCDSHYSQNDPNPNIWSTEAACEDDATAEGWDPEDCTPFCDAGSGNCGSGFWKIDPERCVMRCSQNCGEDCCLGCGGRNAMCQYEQVCARRVNAVLDEFV